MNRFLPVVAVTTLLLVASSTLADDAFTCGTCLDHRAHAARQRLTSSALGQKRLLIYRVDFSNFVGAPISSNAAATLISDLNNVYRDMSYGLTTFALAEAGSVITDTLRLPQGSAAYDNNFTRLIEDTRAAAAQAGYNPAHFDFDIVCTGARPSAIFGAIAYVGGPGLWLANSNFNLGVAAHELGHNFGLPHASFWFTGGRSSIGPGVLQEYGDLFDSMGVPGGSTSHFNARLKNLLGWIPDVDAPFIVSNGTYRLTAHDYPNATGVRALRVARNDAKTYWLEFRNNFNNRWVTNGVTLRWGGAGAENTLLIDTTPGTTAVRDDAPILIGRTFSDRCLGLHITPIGKVGSSPEAIDVVINRGPFPSNLPPDISITASSLTVATGEVVTLTATASDPDGDPLAYHWGFGDGNFSGNESSVDHAWTRAGGYVARCTVSDMKGGVASRFVSMRVGTNSTLRLVGVVRRDGLPVEGALISTGARFSYSSGGFYQIAGLNPGRYTLSGVLDGYDLIPDRFQNPISINTSMDGLDFVAIPAHFNSFALVQTGAVWKYLDTGVAPSADWTTLSFDDSTWKFGLANFGYGVGDVRTQIDGGPVGNRHITTWFRHLFVVTNTAGIDYLVCRLRRDDGAVVYFNGHEVYRENLPSVGAITPTTPALVNVTTGEERTFFARHIPLTVLQTGTNVLAIEVHHFSTNDTDLSMDCELAAFSDDAEVFRPELTIERSGTNAVLSWPIAFASWSLYRSPALTSSIPESKVGVGISNGLHSALIGTTNAAGFFWLRKQTFCRPFE